MPASWDEVARACEADKSSAVHGYMDSYEFFCSGAASVLEVGVFKGASMRMWRSLVAGDVVGLDVDLSYYTPVPGVEVHEVDATDKAGVEAVLGDRTFDLIVDDGCHELDPIIRTAEILAPHLSPSGVYAIEDLTDLHLSQRAHCDPVALALPGLGLKGLAHVQSNMDTYSMLFATKG